MKRITTFLREAAAELKKVVWPSRKESFKTTWVVIAFSLLVAIYLGLFDFGLTKVIELIVE